jgi:hypothetical protein
MPSVLPLFGTKIEAAESKSGRPDRSILRQGRHSEGAGLRERYPLGPALGPFSALDGDLSL